MTVTMYDSVSVGLIPPNAEAVAGYVGGYWTTFPELRGRFPHAQLVSIAVNASEDAECFDVENGDATPADAPAWFRRQTARGVKRPCLYTSLSNVNVLVRILESAGIHRNEYRLWVAHYTGRPHFCGPSEGLVTNADACQYYDRALGRNLDVSICEDTFFDQHTNPVVNTWQPGDERNWCVEWDRIAGKKELRYHLRRLYLRDRMLVRRHLITVDAKRTGWTLRNRLYRYKQLQRRSG